MGIYNNSKLKLYETCPRLFYLSSVLNLRRKSSYANLDRDEGSLFHEMLALWMNPDDPHRNDLVRTCINVYYLGRQQVAELDIEAEAMAERQKYMHDLWDAYLRRYPNETWVVQAVEQKGATCLGDECYVCGEPYPERIVRGEDLIRTCLCDAAIHYIVGVADALVLENGVFKLVDHKTKGGKSPSVSDAFLASFHESRQFTGYMYIFTRVLGRPVAMGIANCIAKLKTIDKRGNPFKRALEIVRTAADYKAYVSDTISLINIIENELEQLEVNPNTLSLGPVIPKEGTAPFRRNTDACRNYGLCEMYAICHPARADWWAVPFDVADDFEISDTDYVRDYRKLADQERV